MLLEGWNWAKDGDGQVVLIAGEAGIGKSTAAARPSRRADGRAATSQSTISARLTTPDSMLHPVVAQLERAAGFASHDEPADRLAKLEALLAQGAEQLDEGTPLVGALLGIPD